MQMWTRWHWATGWQQSSFGCRKSTLEPRHKQLDPVYPTETLKSHILTKPTQGSNCSRHGSCILWRKKEAFCHVRWFIGYLFCVLFGGHCKWAFGCTLCNTYTAGCTPVLLAGSPWNISVSLSGQLTDQTPGLESLPEHAFKIHHSWSWNVLFI